MSAPRLQSLQNYVLVLAICASCILSRCYCPPQCSFPPCEASNTYERSYCVDYEAQTECNIANMQVTDMVDSTGRNADLYLGGLLSFSALGKNASINITPQQASFLRSKLSEALEHGKPIGDCSDGLITDTHLANVNDVCFSPGLFQQCDRLAILVPDYFAGIHVNLKQAILNDTASKILGLIENPPAGSTATQPVLASIAADFVQAIQNRDSINRDTAKIRCKGYTSTVDIIRSEGIPNNPSVFILSSVLLFVYVLSF